MGEEEWTEPVRLPATLTDDWPARKQWTTRAEDGPSVDWTALAQQFGHCLVSVTLGDDGTRHEMALSRVLAHFQAASPPHLEPWYVRDWHVLPSLRQPSATAVYRPPPHCEPDWLNAFCDRFPEHMNHQDYRFIYLGQRGSWTPLHADVFRQVLAFCRRGGCRCLNALSWQHRSYSWSTNIVGRKRWYLFPPDQEPLLCDSLGNFCPFRWPLDASTIEPRLIKQFPRILQAHYRVVDQVEGETLLVPSDWFHQVENLTDCLSINHNGFNATNVLSVTRHLIREQERVQATLQDLLEPPVTMPGTEFQAQCHQLMRDHCGMSLDTLAHLLQWVLDPVDSKPFGAVSGPDRDRVHKALALIQPLLSIQPDCDTRTATRTMDHTTVGHGQ